VFARANARCQGFGLDLRVSPHTLRHCFAVHMLGLLLRQTVIALGEDPGRNVTSAQVKRLLVGNPLRTLQQLLGHASEATVYAYLDVLDEAQEIVAAALGRWDADAARLSAVGGEAGARRGQPDTGSGAAPAGEAGA
jgi:integrase